jgi:hypothetical protein
LIRNLCEQLRATFKDKDGETSNRHLEDLLKMVQKSISKENVFLPATEDDEKKLKTMKNRIGYRNVKSEKVTKEDVKKHNKIDETFKKKIDPVTKTPIFYRPCKQTIEWRSTMMNFIRFEKKLEEK